MALHFRRATDNLVIWSASDRYSFVISNESRSGPGLHGEPGFVASWRPIFEQASCPGGRFAVQHVR
jgi:hypothetical protein